MTSPMSGKKEDLDRLLELNRLVLEDMDLGPRIKPHETLRDESLKRCAQKAREAETVFQRDAGAMLRRREEVRAEILAIWKARHDDRVTLALPSAKVSRRNYEELKVLDRDALYDALDRANRLDLAHHAFDEKAVLDLARKGKLVLPPTAAELVDHYNLQVNP